MCISPRRPRKRNVWGGGSNEDTPKRAGYGEDFGEGGMPEYAIAGEKVKTNILLVETK